MKGVIYARYSSENQKEESIEGQIRECTAYAERNGITILGSYIDRALSAKTDNRPDFQRMVADSSKNMFDVIIVWKLDRFARNRYDSAYYKHLLKKNNVKVISATEAISQGAEGIILESVLEGMAEYYSAELAEKIVRGMTENALKCKYNGGTIPVGYKISKDKYYEIDPLTAPLVIEAFNKYKDGVTMKEIVKYLDSKGLRNSLGGKMNLNCISRLLQNRRYIGEYRYKDIVTPDGIPALISKDLFDAVQERLKSNKKAPAMHKAEDDYLLTTKLYCGDCESFMVGESGTSHTMKKYYYYKCASAKKRKGCKKKAVKKDWIEDTVLSEVKEFLNDNLKIEKLIKIILEEYSKENTNIPRLEKDLSHIEKQINNMLNAIQDGIYTSSTRQRLEELESRKEEVKIMLAREKIGRPQLTEKQLRDWFDKMRSYNTDFPEYRRRLIDSFINCVVVFDDYIEILLNYKDGTKRIAFKKENNFFSEGSDSSPPARPFSLKCLKLQGFRHFFICLVRAWFFSKNLTNQEGKKIMRKKPTIRMKSKETAAEVFELFLLTKRADGVKPRTIETYKQHFHAMSKHLDINQEIAEMTATDLKKMIVSMQDKGLAPNSIKSYTITLKAFLSWCNAEGITSLNMKKYKGEETIKETYTDEELKILLQKPNMKKCTFAEYRTWVVVNFLINSGSRAATIRNIQNRDVDMENNVIYARHTKNRKALVIPLCSQMSAVLMEYMKIRGGKQDDYLFPSESGEQMTESGFRCSIVNYNRSRGVTKTSTHLFRHTFAKKYLVDCGGNALMLQKLLGHSTLDMTKHYCAIFDTEITKDFDSFSPLAKFSTNSERIKMPKRS